jgi:hypothetical protein
MTLAKARRMQRITQVIQADKPLQFFLCAFGFLARALHIKTLTLV